MLSWRDCIAKNKSINICQYSRDRSRYTVYSYIQYVSIWKIQELCHETWSAKKFNEANLNLGDVPIFIYRICCIVTNPSHPTAYVLPQVWHTWNKMYSTCYTLKCFWSLESCTWQVCEFTVLAPSWFKLIRTKRSMSPCYFFLIRNIWSAVFTW